MIPDSRESQQNVRVRSPRWQRATRCYEKWQPAEAQVTSTGVQRAEYDVAIRTVFYRPRTIWERAFLAHPILSVAMALLPLG